ncbi:MAG: helix-turn-helix transcriptional regulator [Bacteroidetes bacterium]|nr:helix-turn-helix transcriptional regulator [Bacteroidota bacterium]
MNFRDENWLKQFAKNLKKIREEKNFTQEKLAYQSGLSLSQIARIETAKTNPTLCTIVVIAKTLKVDASLLLDLKFK